MIKLQERAKQVQKPASEAQDKLLSDERKEEAARFFLIYMQLPQ
jgi:hypothetical protein